MRRCHEKLQIHQIYQNEIKFSHLLHLLTVLAYVAELLKNHNKTFFTFKTWSLSLSLQILNLKTLEICMQKQSKAKEKTEEQNSEKGAPLPFLHSAIRAGETELLCPQRKPDQDSEQHPWEGRDVNHSVIHFQSCLRCTWLIIILFVGLLS